MNGVRNSARGVRSLAGRVRSWVRGVLNSERRRTARCPGVSDFLCAQGRKGAGGVGCPIFWGCQGLGLPTAVRRTRHAEPFGPVVVVAQASDRSQPIAPTLAEQ